MGQEHEYEGMYTSGTPENVEEAYGFLFEGDASTAANYLKQNPDQVHDFVKEAEKSGPDVLLHLTSLIQELVKK